MRAKMQTDLMEQKNVLSKVAKLKGDVDIQVDESMSKMLGLTNESKPQQEQTGDDQTQDNDKKETGANDLASTFMSNIEQFRMKQEEERRNKGKLMTKLTKWKNREDIIDSYVFSHTVFFFVIKIL